MVADYLGFDHGGGVKLAEAGRVGADGVDVEAGGQPVAADYGGCGGGGERKDVHAFHDFADAAGYVHRDADLLGYIGGELALGVGGVHREAKNAI